MTLQGGLGRGGGSLWRAATPKLTWLENHSGAPTLGNAALAGVIFLGPDPGRISGGTWGISEGRSPEESLRSQPWSRGFLSFFHGCHSRDGLLSLSGHRLYLDWAQGGQGNWREYPHDEEAVATSQLHGAAGGEGRTELSGSSYFPHVCRAPDPLGHIPPRELRAFTLFPWSVRAPGAPPGHAGS